MYSRYILSLIFTTVTAFFTTGLLANDISVESLSEGACWLDQGENLKLVSFNEKENLIIGREEIENKVFSLLYQKKNMRAQFEVLSMSLHCGGYGASLVLRTRNDDKAQCVWLKINKGELEVRSLGGLEETKNDICDGYRPGVLIVGVKDLSQKSFLESAAFQSKIIKVNIVSGTTLKVELHSKYHGREKLVIEELKSMMDLRYIDLNLLQHPIGESVNLK